MTLGRVQAKKYRAPIVRGAIVLALLALVLATPTMTTEQASAAPVVPATNPNSVVPDQFRSNKSWSEEGAWHWVTVSYDGTQRFSGTNYDYSIGKPLPVATFVATRVRSLSATDPCPDCVFATTETEGPPSVLGGLSNPALKNAYAHLDNGPRRVIQSANPQVKRWTRGTWYLNYSPISRTFFSWTWIPDDGALKGATSSAEISTSVLPSLTGIGTLNVSQTAGSRVFPLGGPYRISQGFGCVPLNSGYASPSFCPADLPSYHDGVDLAAQAGTPILAAASGTVTFAGIDSTSSRNSMIVINHDGGNAGFETIYLHWEKSYVKKGDRVSAGQVIAAVGSIGYSTGPHLHFSVRVAATNQTIDPLAWLGGSVQLATTSTAALPAYAGVLRWQSLIVQAAAARNVPAGLIAAIMAVESGGNPDSVSPAGALGLMQIMPDQLTRLGVPRAKWTDPAANIDAAARYLAETLNGGGTIQQAVERYFGSGCDVLGTCTQEYANRVMTLYVYFTTWIESGTAPALPALVPPVAATMPVEPVVRSTGSGQEASTTTTSNETGTAASTPSPVPTPPDATVAPATPPASAPTATPTPAPEPTATATPTPTPTATPTPASTPSATPTVTPTQTPAASTTPTETPTSPPESAPPATEVPAQGTPAPVPVPNVSQPDTATPAAIPEVESGSSSQAAQPVQGIIGPTLSELRPPLDSSETAAAPTATPTQEPVAPTPTP